MYVYIQYLSGVPTVGFFVPAGAEPLRLPIVN